MPFRPRPLRAPAPTRAALVLPAVALALGACRRAPSLLPTPGTHHSADERAGVLACVREAAGEAGFRVTTDGDEARPDGGSAPAATLAEGVRLASAPAAADAPTLRAAAAGAAPVRDLLVVRFGDEPTAPTPRGIRLRNALRVSVQSFRLAFDVEARGDAPVEGREAPPPAARANWQPTAASPRAVEARALVLARCSNLTP